MIAQIGKDVIAFKFGERILVHLLKHIGTNNFKVEQLATLRQKGYDFALTVHGAGDVYITGGSNLSEVLDQAKRFNLKKNKWY